MRSILIVSHGTMAKGIFESASMIFGELNNVHYICLENGMGIEKFSFLLNKLLDKISGSNEIVVLADLKGGSPYNTTVSLLSEKALLDKSVVFSGMNLPMLLSILFMKEQLNTERKIEIINSSKDGIESFEIKVEDEEII